MYGTKYGIYIVFHHSLISTLAHRYDNSWRSTDGLVQHWRLVSLLTIPPPQSCLLVCDDLGEGIVSDRLLETPDPVVPVLLVSRGQSKQTDISAGHRATDLSLSSPVVGV